MLKRIILQNNCEAHENKNNVFTMDLLSIWWVGWMRNKQTINCNSINPLIVLRCWKGFSIFLALIGFRWISWIWNNFESMNLAFFEQKYIKQNKNLEKRESQTHQSRTRRLLPWCERDFDNRFVHDYKVKTQ